MEQESIVFMPTDVVVHETQVSSLDLLPSKSRSRYEKEFKVFDEWRKGRDVRCLNEDVLFAYFTSLAKTSKSSSLWTKYSMLKSTLKVYEDVDISRFRKINSYLKGQAKNHKPKRAKSFEREHIEKFLLEAPDDYLMMKVALLMGISGACRCEELTRMSVDDIQDKGSYLLISIADTETNKARSFTMIGEGHSVNALDVYRKYALLRPRNIDHRRFFLNYRNKKCTVQPVGINTFAKIPRTIAAYLKLPDPDSYTGHCFRRSSATLLVNAGGGLMTQKRRGGWNSSTVTEGLELGSVEESLHHDTSASSGLQVKEEPEDPDSSHSESFIVPDCLLSSSPSTTGHEMDDSVPPLTMDCYSNASEKGDPSTLCLPGPNRKRSIEDFIEAEVEVVDEESNPASESQENPSASFGKLTSMATEFVDNKKRKLDTEDNKNERKQTAMEEKLSDILERMVSAEDRRTAFEERCLALKQRKILIEEKKVLIEEEKAATLKRIECILLSYLSKG